MDGQGLLEGRTALVTGAARGLGLEIARQLVAHGAKVWLNGREKAALDQAAGDIGQGAEALPFDIADEQATATAIAQLEAGGLDILVNNAAYQQWVDGLQGLSDEQFDQTMKTNLYAMFWLTKAALPHLGSGAAIINTSSEVAASPPTGLIDYSMTKSAILSFTKTMAKQLAAKGVRVNAVTPGPIWTPLQVCGGQPPENIPQFGASTPVGRAGQPVELAPLYVALADPAFSYSTGQVFGATGGDPQPAG